MLDTSVTFSAFVFGGKPLDIVIALQSSESSLVLISAAMQAELIRVLRRKGRDLGTVLQAIQRYFALCEVIAVSSDEGVKICRDEQDNFILDCALQGRADVLITADADLLALRTSPEIGSLVIMEVSAAHERFVMKQSHVTGSAWGL